MSTSPSNEPEVRNANKSHFEAACGVALVVSLGVFLGGLQSHFKSHTLWIVILFAIPLAVQVEGLIVLYRKNKLDGDPARAVFSRFYLMTMPVCLCCYCSLWWIYSHLEWKYDWLSTTDTKYKYDLMIYEGARPYLIFWSAFSLVLILILLLLVARMTYAIIEGRILKEGDESYRKDWRFWNLDYLRTGAAQVPFLALLFFLSVFLGVSYLFGLALAFHDKTHSPNDPALYMSNLNPLPNPVPTPSLSPQSPQTPAPTRGPTPEEFTIKFVQGFAAVPLPSPTDSPSSTPIDSRAKQRTGTTQTPVPEPNAAEPNYFLITKEKDERTRDELHRNWETESTNNKVELDKIIPAIRTSTEKHDRLRVVITGYSDAANLSGTIYKSNYELAEARAQNTKQMILERLSESPKNREWRNLEWVILSLSNELPGSEKIARVRLEGGLEDSASVILRGQHPNPLSLMDYIYFANYTITTTGYGDIVPTTPYSKFICSFANICEVFFLVVFFNVLLSLRREDRSLSDEEIGKIADKIGKLTGEDPHRNNDIHQDPVQTAQQIRVLKRNDSANKRKIREIETSMEAKADKIEIEALVKQALKSFFSKPFSFFR